MNNIFVYCEIEDGKVADVSLELLTKGRVLADTLGCELEALARIVDAAQRPDGRLHEPRNRLAHRREKRQRV